VSGFSQIFYSGFGPERKVENLPESTPVPWPSLIRIEIILADSGLDWTGIFWKIGGSGLYWTEKIFAV